MRRRPFTLYLCALLFLYFPAEFAFRLHGGAPLETMDFILSVALPAILLVGLIRVSKFGWYTLVALVALWGVEDLYRYYHSYQSGMGPLLVHLGIYFISLTYFINPRVRHLYFDPKMRWWRTKPRYETHLPFMLKHGGKWQYPILRNVSEGGCFIETPHLVDVNSKLDISIPLPVPLNLSVIQTSGQVRWVSSNPLRHGVGVQFDEVSPEVARALREYVHNQL